MGGGGGGKEGDDEEDLALLASRLVRSRRISFVKVTIHLEIFIGSL